MRIICPESLKIAWLGGKRNAQLSATFIVKGVFKLQHQASAISYEEGELALGDVYAGVDQSKELAYSADLVPFKPRADLLIAADAQLSGGRSATSLPVGFRVGEYAKELRVIGNRRRELKMVQRELSDPEPFVKMPVSYRLALGGAGSPTNPIGRGLGDSEAAANVEYPDRFRSTTEPAGFGPIAGDWQQRRRLLGTYDDDWLKKRWPWFPEDFDWGYFNAAPADQQLSGYLRGDEEIEFFNLHPEHSTYRSHLPGLRVRCFVGERTGTDAVGVWEVPLQLDTLFADLRLEKLILVWRGVTPAQTLKLREIEHVLVATEPLAEKPKEMAHYRNLMLAAPEDEEEPKSDPGDADFEKVFEKMDLEFAEMNKEFFVLEEKAAQAEEEQLAETLSTDENRDVWQKSAKPAASFEEVKDALAAQIAEFRQSNPEHAEGLAQLELGNLEQMEAELAAAEKDMATDEEVRHTRESVQQAVASGKSLAGQDLSKLDLSGLDLSRALLAGAVLKEANLEGAKLSGANLTEAELRKANLKRADLTGAVLTDADFTWAVLEGVQLKGAILDDTVLRGLDLRNIDFSGCVGMGADFSRSDLTGARFVSSKFPKADFSRCRLQGCNFSRAALQAAQFEEVEAPDIVFMDADITGLHGSGRSNFAGGDFSSAIANRAIFGEANLERANFTKTLLFRARFSDANLRGALFDRSDMGGAVFEDATLDGAQMTNAQLLRASFDRADLANASLAGSNLYEAGFWEAHVTELTDFSGANLKGTTLA